MPAPLVIALCGGQCRVHLDLMTVEIQYQRRQR